MDQLTLIWEGPYEMFLETPDHLYGKNGVFAIDYRNQTIYIGKAEGKNAVFREAKRHNKMIKCLVENGYISNEMNHLAAYNHVDKNCFIYVALIEKEYLINNAEKCLIFNCKPLICNTQGRKKYLGTNSISLTNIGSLPADIKRQYTCLK